MYFEFLFLRFSLFYAQPLFSATYFSCAYFLISRDLIPLLFDEHMHHSGDEDWIKIANSEAPAAFAKRFEGETQPFAQKASKDMKLMDAVFDMCIAPYARTFPEVPWSEVDMNGPKAIQKFVHVALQVRHSNAPL